MGNLQKAIDTAAAAVKMLKKSEQLSLFGEPHHVAYTRTNQSGKTSQIQAKGPTPIAKQFQTKPGELYHRGDKARYTGNVEQQHGGTFHEIEMLEGHMKGQKQWTQKAPETPAITPSIKPKWDGTGSYEEYVEANWPEIDQHFAEGGTMRQANKKIDDMEWPAGAVNYFKEKHKAKRQASNYSPRSGADARVDQILRTMDSTGKATARKFR